MAINVVPYVSPSAQGSGTIFKIVFEGDGSSTSVVVDLEDLKNALGIQALPTDRIVGANVTGVTGPGSPTVTSATVSARQLTLNFSAAPASGTTYTVVSIEFYVKPN